MNHLQDCGKDLVAMDRCYLPADLLARHGGHIEDLRYLTLTPALRAVVNDLLVEVVRLNELARELPMRTMSRRLRVETGSIVSPGRKADPPPAKRRPAGPAG